MIIACSQAERKPRSIIAERLRAIATRTRDPEVAELVEEVVAIEDRQTRTEAAIHHICDKLGIYPHDMPDVTEVPE